MDDKWRQYEEAKKALPPMEPKKYEQALKELAKKYGV